MNGPGNFLCFSCTILKKTSSDVCAVLSVYALTVVQGLPDVIVDYNGVVGDIDVTAVQTHVASENRIVLAINHFDLCETIACTLWAKAGYPEAAVDDMSSHAAGVLRMKVKP